MRYKNWKMYYTMSQPGPAGWIMPLIPFHFTLVDNIKRDPFEQAVGIDQKTAMSMGGALGGPLTAFQYDWNMLPIGQQLWLKHLLTFEQFPPLQAARDLQPQRDHGAGQEGECQSRGRLARATNAMSRSGRPRWGARGPRQRPLELLSALNVRRNQIPGRSTMNRS